MLAVEEAGNVVSDIFGNALNFSLGGTLASNQGVVVAPPNIHDAVLEETRNVVLG